MKRFSIFVQETFADYEVEHIQVDAGAEDIAEQLRRKTFGRGKDRTPRYQRVRVQENQP